MLRDGGSTPWYLTLIAHASRLTRRSPYLAMGVVVLVVLFLADTLAVLMRPAGVSSLQASWLMSWLLFGSGLRSGLFLLGCASVAWLTRARPAWLLAFLSPLGDEGPSALPLTIIPSPAIIVFTNGLVLGLVWALSLLLGSELLAWARAEQSTLAVRPSLT